MSLPHNLVEATRLAMYSGDQRGANFSYTGSLLRIAAVTLGFRRSRLKTLGALPLTPGKGSFANSTGIPDLPRGLVQTGRFPSR